MSDINPPLDWSPRVDMIFISPDDRFVLNDSMRNGLLITISPNESKREPTEDEKAQGVISCQENLNVFVKDLSQVPEEYNKLRIEAYRQLVHDKEKQSKEI